MSLEEPIGRIVVENVFTIAATSAAIEAASLMVEKNVGCLIVSQRKKAIGIVTERDILRKVTALGHDPRTVLVKDVMSTMLVTTTTYTTIGEAAKKMVDKSVKRLVVLRDDGEFAGLVTMTDLIRWMARQEVLSDSLINYLMYEVP